MGFTKEQIKERRLKNLAQIIYDHWEEKSGMDTRYFDHPYINDIYVVIGQSVSGGNYREHVVPRAFLRDRCFEFFNIGKSVDFVKNCLMENLLIVKITDEEARKLNNVLKETMPEGWVLGKSDPLERLMHVGIRVA